MHAEHLAISGERNSAIKEWELILRGEAALLENPGRHHKTLIIQAHTMHRLKLINRDDLSDLLEQTRRCSGLGMAVTGFVLSGIE